MIADIETQVCADITARQKKGLAKYGVSVADNSLPLKDWLQHAYEETLDKAIYLKRAISEIEAQEKPESKPVAVWVHEGNGQYIGSVVIVHATNRPEAEDMIRRQLDASGLQAEPLKVTEIVLRGFCSIYFDSGDY